MVNADDHCNCCTAVDCVRVVCCNLHRMSGTYTQRFGRAWPSLRPHCCCGLMVRLLLVLALFLLESLAVAEPAVEVFSLAFY